MTIVFALTLAACDPSDPSPCESSESDTTSETDTGGESSGTDTDTGAASEAGAEAPAGLCCACDPLECEASSDPLACEAAGLVWCERDVFGGPSLCMAQCA